MSRFVEDLLDNISEGIIILNENLEIDFWNAYMTNITKIDKQDVIGKSVFQIMPSLNRKYFVESVKSVISNGRVMFFSAAMHKNLVDCNESLNLKITRLEDQDSRSVMMEFINVTNQIEQINRLKKNVGELCKVNSILTEQEKTIKAMAYNDNLTGIPNRAFFYKKAARFLNSAKIHHTILGLMFIDVDEFKNINDSYGHLFGDRILVKVAKVLEKVVGDSGLVSRYGGDEFLVLLHNMDDIEDYNKIVEDVSNMHDKILHIDDKEVSISLSAGVSFYPYDGQTIDELMAKADESMYKNKRISQ